jgi:hypothetical protein
MKIIHKPIKKDVILKMHNRFFKTMIKAVVDTNREVMALDAELHADLEQLLLSEGCKQENLWGINLFLQKERAEWIEYTALINIRPSMDNPSMEVQNPRIRKKIARMVNTLITE